MAKNKSTTAGRRRVTFEVKAPVGSEVFLAGSFNDWDDARKPMVDKDGSGLYTCTCLLPRGQHEYKYVVDGVWSVDAENPNFSQNPMGTLNSVITVE
jgi:5'-AMP-activated protein kinase regulatory beta subunit